MLQNHSSSNGSKPTYADEDATPIGAIGMDGSVIGSILDRIYQPAELPVPTGSPTPKTDEEIHDSPKAPSADEGKKRRKEAIQSDPMGLNSAIEDHQEAIEERAEGEWTPNWVKVFELWRHAGPIVKSMVFGIIVVIVVGYGLIQVKDLIGSSHPASIVTKVAPPMAQPQQASAWNQGSFGVLSKSQSDKRSIAPRCKIFPIHESHQYGLNKPAYFGFVFQDAVRFQITAFGLNFGKQNPTLLGDDGKSTMYDFKQMQSDAEKITFELQGDKQHSVAERLKGLHFSQTFETGFNLTTPGDKRVSGTSTDINGVTDTVTYTFTVE